MKDDCVYYHSDGICDGFLRTGLCPEPKGDCWLRHPKECKHWLGDTRGCLRGELCKYLHKTENEGKNLKGHEHKHHASEKEPGGTNPKRDTNNVKDQEKDNSTNGEQENKEICDDNIVDMEEEFPLKNNTNDETNRELAELKEEKKTLNDQVEKLQRIIYNMNKALKARNE